MKTCILWAIIIVAMTNGSRAENQINQNSLITTYDPEEALPESPNFTSNGETAAENHRPKNKGNVRFESQNPGHPTKFEDNPTKKKLDDIDEVESYSLLAEVNKIVYNQSNRIFNTGKYEIESNISENKMKFEGNNDEQEISDYHDGKGEDIVLQEKGNKIVFEDDENYDDFLKDSEIGVESNDRPIKFENQHSESYTNKRDSDRNSVTERVVFKDVDYKSQQPVHRRKRKPRRKPGFNGKPTNPGPMAPNSHSGYGYPGYPGVGYPGPDYPGPGDQNAEYPNYPIPGYPAPGYPYLNYNNHYPGMAFPTSGSPSNYPPIGQGYGVYPLPGFQNPEGQRPYVGPTAYPSDGQGDSNGLTGANYPNQEYGGSPSPVAPQNGQGVAPYAGPDYPYNQGNPVPGYPPSYPYDPYAQYPPQGQSQYRPPGHYQPGYPNGPQRPSRRPKSLTERAMSAVAEALTSIALYDDQQCVPRILCEMAGGSTASSPTLLKASAGLQPLLTLLQAYNGVSTSPLFVFGRATVTGITAKGNPSACYRAYPQCPRDPEKLINYLNNHNGGFFRFFGQPDTPQQTHNLEQFYNYLSGQNGLPQHAVQSQQGYGFQKPNGYGLLPQNAYAQSYKYGQNDNKKQFLNRNVNSIESEVEERIQNKPVENILEADSDLNSDESQFTGSKWSFPDEGNKNSYRRDKVKIRKQPERGSKTLKFPDDRSDYRGEVQKVTDYTRKEKRLYFPEQSNYHKYVNYYETTTPVNPDEYYFDYKHNFYVKRPKALETDDVVYVVRGNGDPNHPEIIRVKPGQTI